MRGIRTLMKQGGDKDIKMRRWSMILSMLICILFAGVIGNDMPLGGKNKPADPRKTHGSIHVINPMDPSYPYAIPNDAVILTQEGFYIYDHEKGFKRISESP